MNGHKPFRARIQGGVLEGVSGGAVATTAGGLYPHPYFGEPTTSATSGLLPTSASRTSLRGVDSAQVRHHVGGSSKYARASTRSMVPYSSQRKTAEVGKHTPYLTITSARLSEP